MKQLKTMKTFWNILCGVFVCMAFFNFLMPDSGNEEMLIFRRFLCGDGNPLRRRVSFVPRPHQRA